MHRRTPCRRIRRHARCVARRRERGRGIPEDHVIARAPPAGIQPASRWTITTSTFQMEEAKARAPIPIPAQAPSRSAVVGSAMTGSVSALSRATSSTHRARRKSSQICRFPFDAAQTVVRAHGPIEHVIYIIKENRTYDQVLGDLPIGDSDPSLAWFGKTITPNEHAIALRFGVFDRPLPMRRLRERPRLVDRRVCQRFSNVSGHWTTADGAAVRFRRGATASAPGTGYIWDDADKHGVSLRDYGDRDRPANRRIYTTHMAGRWQDR